MAEITSHLTRMLASLLLSHIRMPEMLLWDTSLHYITEHYSEHQMQPPLLLDTNTITFIWCLGWETSGFTSVHCKILPLTNTFCLNCNLAIPDTPLPSQSKEDTKIPTSKTTGGISDLCFEPGLKPLSCNNGAGPGTHGSEE